MVFSFYGTGDVMRAEDEKNIVELEDTVAG